MKDSTKSLQTKMTLSNALKSLLEIKPLEKITIKMITDECGYNRQTFYYHFDDIYSILIWMFKRDLIPLIEDLEGELLWKEGLMQIFDYLAKNRKLCNVILRSIDRFSVYEFFTLNVRAIVEKTVNKYVLELGLSEKSQTLIAEYYILSIGSILETWVLGQLDYSPEELIDFLDTLLADHIAGVRYRKSEEERKKTTDL